MLKSNSLSNKKTNDLLTTSKNISKTNNAKKKESISERNLTFISNKTNRLILPSYPKVGRKSFRSDWFKLVEWFEYCPKKAIAYCYPSRIFCNRETKEISFSMTEYEIIF